MIVILEDNERRIAAMTSVLRKVLPAASAICFEDARQMLAWLADRLGEADLISLDHDLPVRRDEENRLIDCGTGREVANYLAALPPTCPVIVPGGNGGCPSRIRLAVPGGASAGRSGLDWRSVGRGGAGLHTRGVDCGQGFFCG